MASNIALSVVIPYLKANQETIHQSLNSLFAQSLKNIEFIFVDDGCTDESRAIIEQYALQDERISILYNEKNSGPGFSRNEGINHAQGEYLAFFDLDDIVDENFYEKLFNTKYSVTKASGTKCDDIVNVCLRQYSSNTNLTTSYGQGIGSGAGYIELSNGTYTVDSSMN